MKTQRRDSSFTSKKDIFKLEMNLPLFNISGQVKCSQYQKHVKFEVWTHYEAINLSN